MLALVKRIEPHRVGRTRGPQSHHVDVAASPTDDRSVISHGFDCLVGVPDGAGDASRSDDSLYAAAKVDVVDHLRSFEFPWISERQPLLRILLLPTIADNLAKQAMIISNSIAARWYSQGCHALHETG